jgi:hypothetical protein
MNTDMIIILASLGLIALILFVVLMNLRDEMRFKKLLNDDYRRRKRHPHKLT